MWRFNASFNIKVVLKYILKAFFTETHEMFQDFHVVSYETHVLTLLTRDHMWFTDHVDTLLDAKF